MSTLAVLLKHLTDMTVQFEYARDCVKQLITLATGTIALAITFAKDFVGSASPLARTVALCSWSAFLLSVVFGVWALLALTGTIAAGEGGTINDRNIRLPAILQILAFLVGLALTVLFGALGT